MTTISIKAYNAFYKENRRGVQNFIFKMTHNVEIAEELVNDVFVKLYQNMEKFDSTKASLKTWVYNIATNATIDFLRKKKLNVTSINDVLPTDDGEFNPIDFATEDADPLAQLIENESFESIQRGIKNLTPQQAEIITHYSLGYSYEDIATELNLPLGTVKGSMHMARNRMREFFQKPVLA